MDERSAELRAPEVHALLLPVPFQGHINPFVQLGQRLAALGVRVTLATTQHLHTKILRAQEALPQPITARHAHFTLVGIPDGLPHTAAPTGVEVMDAMEKLEDPVLDLVHTLATQGLPITCIVADFFLRWSPSLARRSCLPEFIFWPQCAAVLSMFLHVDALTAAGYDASPTGEQVAAIAGRDPMDEVGCIPGLPHYHIRYADLPFQDSRGSMEIVEWTVELIQHRLKNLPAAHGVLVNSFEALEAEVSKSLASHLHRLMNHPPHTCSPASFLRLIGPLVATKGEVSGTSLWEEEEVDCMQWLDEQPVASVIFIAFGSLATFSCKEQVQELAKGLVTSGQRFLWVLRKDAIRYPNIEDSMTTMKIEDALPHGFLEEIEGIGKVVHWAPQVRVLSHPSIGGFFSHCGWNSILESINAGVPILGWPSFVDHFPNCRLGSHVWRIGVELKRDSLNETTRDDVTNGVRELMQGPRAQALHSHAIELKNLAEDAMLFSCELLAFVDDIHKLASTNACKCLNVH